MILGILGGRARKSKQNEIQTPKISLVAFFNLRHKSNNVSILINPEMTPLIPHNNHASLWRYSNLSQMFKASVSRRAGLHLLSILYAQIAQFLHRLWVLGAGYVYYLCSVILAHISFVIALSQGTYLRNVYIALLMSQFLAMPCLYSLQQETRFI